MSNNVLSDVLPYNYFLDQGLVNLRDNGVLVGYWFSGPSPEISDAADLASRSRLFGNSLVHLSTGDTVQVLYDRLPAPEPAKCEFTHKAAELVHAEQLATFAAEEHWITPTRLYLSNQFELLVTSWVKALLLSGQGPQRQDSRALLREQALKRFSAFVNAAGSAVGLTRMSNIEMFRDLLRSITYHEFPAALPDPHVLLHKVIGSERQFNGTAPSINSWHLRPVVITLYASETAPQILAVLLRQPGHMTVSARYLCLDPYAAEQLLENDKRHWNRTIDGTIGRAFRQWLGQRQDPEAARDSREQLSNINAALTAAAAGTSFGVVTITAIVRDRDPDRVNLRAHETLRELHAMGILGRLED